MLQSYQFKLIFEKGIGFFVNLIKNLLDFLKRKVDC